MLAFRRVRPMRRDVKCGPLTSQTGNHIVTHYAKPNGYAPGRLQASAPAPPGRPGARNPRRPQSFLSAQSQAAQAGGPLAGALPEILELEVVGFEDLCGVAMMDGVTSEIEISAPIDRVFKALTDPKQLFDWWGSEPSVQLTKFDMEPRKGGRWRFECKPVAGMPQGPVLETLRRNGAEAFEAHGKVLEYDPPRLLAWSWIANWHEDPKHETVVRWELTPVGKKTRVRVTHTGLERERVAAKDYESGWLGVLRLLLKFLEEQ